GEAARAHGVTTSQHVALSVLRPRDGMSSAALARWAFVTPQAMRGGMSRLAKRRLVPRRPDPQNARVLRTSVTRKGLALLWRCDGSMDAIEADMLRDVPPESVELLRQLLGTFAHSLEETDRGSPFST